MAEERHPGLQQHNGGEPAFIDGPLAGTGPAPEERCQSGHLIMAKVLELPGGVADGATYGSYGRSIGSHGAAHP